VWRVQLASSRSLFTLGVTAEARGVVPHIAADFALVLLVHLLLRVLAVVAVYAIEFAFPHTGRMATRAGAAISPVFAAADREGGFMPLRLER